MNDWNPWFIGVGFVIGGAATFFAAPLVAATAGAWGLLGAASTGTSIATLSGAALSNASLAAIGGGAVSAGGFGIAGGTAAISGAGVIAGGAIGKGLS